MRRIKFFIIILCCTLAFGPNLQAQDSEWELIHRGNKAFREKHYETAGSFYSKALKLNPSSSRALYNLANVRLAQREDSTALELYSKAAREEHSRLVRSMASHNQGYIYQRKACESGNSQAQQSLLRSAISHYKQALRENPASEASRYNLALCQKQLKKDGSGGGGGQKNQPQENQQAPPQKNPLSNYAQQAERQTRKKINQSQGQRALEKNW